MSGTALELDFQTQLTDLTNFLKSQSIFNGYNFDGPNFAVLLRTLAYNTIKNGYYLNMTNSEAYLDSAQLPNSINSRAKELNYLPKSYTCAKAIVTLTGAPSNNQIQQIIVPSGQTFTAAANGFNYIFQTNENITLLQANNFTQSNVALIEGFPVTEIFTVSGNSFGQFYTFQNETIDTETLSVTVQVSNTNTNNTIYEYTDTLLDLTGNSTVYFLQPAYDNNYQIYFGDNIFGNMLTDGNMIVCNYLCSSGNTVNGISQFQSQQIFASNTQVILYANCTSTAAGGSSQESSQTTKFYAPKYQQSQNRAITAVDYQSLIINNFNDVSSINVFGGETLVPPQYGRVFICASTYSGNMLTNNRQNDIINFLSDKDMMQITPVFVNPDYTYIVINTNIDYKKNPNIVNQEQNIIQNVITTITNYQSNNLGVFNSTFRYSKFIALVDSADTSILSNDTVIKLKKIINGVSNLATSYTINFLQALQQHPMLDVSYPSIVSSNFTINGSSCYIKDDGFSNLNIYTQTASGEVVYQQNIGSVNYTAGVITITNLLVQAFDNNQFTFIVEPLVSDIESSQNIIININPNDIAITLTPS